MRQKRGMIGYQSAGILVSDPVGDANTVMPLIFPMAGVVCIMNLLNTACRTTMLSVDDLWSVKEASRTVKRRRGRLDEVRSASGLHGVRYDTIGSSGNHDSTTERDAVRIFEAEKNFQIAELEMTAAKLRLWVKLLELPDVKERIILILRYVDLLPWDAISEQFEGRLDANACRKCCERFLKSVDLKHGSGP